MTVGSHSSQIKGRIDRWLESKMNWLNKWNRVLVLGWNESLQPRKPFADKTENCFRVYTEKPKNKKWLLKTFCWLERLGDNRQNIWVKRDSWMKNIFEMIIIVINAVCWYLPRFGHCLIAEVQRKPQKILNGSENEWMNE